MIRACLLGFVVLLSACAEPVSRAVTTLPEGVKRFEAKAQPRGVARSNIDLAQDFLDLTFALENGEQLPVLLKYPGKIQIVLRTEGLSNYQPEVSNLLQRMRREGGVDIRQTDDPSQAQIHVHALTRRSIDRTFPGAACVVIPGVTSWKELRDPNTGPDQILWSRQRELTVASIFLPADSTPQETRDCLHEELAQALGPANDLYHVADTVFNDDNFHSILTPFDMLMLRTLYHPSLSSGMTRDQVAAIVPGILDQLNRKGRGKTPEIRVRASKSWNRAIERALNRRKSNSERFGAAKRALSIASAMNPPDHRLGMTLLTLGRLTARGDEARSVEYFKSAYRQLSSVLGPNDIRVSRVAWHLAVLAKNAGALDQALALADRHIPNARAAENAITLSGLLAVKADAHWNRGEIEAARRAQREAWAWSHYAFGEVPSSMKSANRKSVV